MRLLLLLRILLLAHSAFAQTDERDHPIDVRTIACVDANPSTRGMLECLVVAYSEWDAELNRVYQELVGLVRIDDPELDYEAEERLRAAQRAWTEFRDAEFEFLGNIYFRPLGGTMWWVVAAETRVDFIRQRTKELGEYLWFFNPEGD